jgi:hypothetical protein
VTIRLDPSAHHAHDRIDALDDRVKALERSCSRGAGVALQAQLDAVGEALGAEALREFDGYHYQAVGALRSERDAAIARAERAELARLAASVGETRQMLRAERAEADSACRNELRAHARDAYRQQRKSDAALLLAGTLGAVGLAFQLLLQECFRESLDCLAADGVTDCERHPYPGRTSIHKCQRCQREEEWQMDRDEWEDKYDALAGKLAECEMYRDALRARVAELEGAVVRCPRPECCTSFNAVDFIDPGARAMKPPAPAEPLRPAAQLADEMRRGVARFISASAAPAEPSAQRSTLSDRGRSGEYTKPAAPWSPCNCGHLPKFHQDNGGTPGRCSKGMCCCAGFNSGQCWVSPIDEDCGDCHGVGSEEAHQAIQDEKGKPAEPSAPGLCMVGKCGRQGGCPLSAEGWCWCEGCQNSKPAEPSAAPRTKITTLTDLLDTPVGKRIVAERIAAGWGGPPWPPSEDEYEEDEPNDPDHRAANAPSDAHYSGVAPSAMFVSRRWWEYQSARAERLEKALRGLLMSADCTWEIDRKGHDWPDACEAARAALEGNDA